MSNNRLRLNIEPVAHPYPNYNAADFEVWGILTVQIIDSKKTVLLLRITWNLDELAEWFAQNQNSLGNEPLAIQGNTPQAGESLAQTIARLRERDFGDDLDASLIWDEAIGQYYRRHNLRVALSGTRIPGIIIGCNNKAGEISYEGQLGKENPNEPNYFADFSNWAYQFDMADFLSDTRSNLQNFLEQWLRTSEGKNPRAIARIEGIKQQLEQVVTSCC